MKGIMTARCGPGMSRRAMVEPQSVCGSTNSQQSDIGTATRGASAAAMVASVLSSSMRFARTIITAMPAKHNIDVWSTPPRARSLAKSSEPG
eukprot:scaffold40081_cov32-Tisochrysis_lutea.AAC.8